MQCQAHGVSQKHYRDCLAINPFAQATALDFVARRVFTDGPSGGSSADAVAGSTAGAASLGGSTAASGAVRRKAVLALVDGLTQEVRPAGLGLLGLLD
jgi:hypothetical protein